VLYQVKTAAWSLAEEAGLPLLAGVPGVDPAAQFGAALRAGTAAMKPLRDIFFKMNPHSIFAGLPGMVAVRSKSKKSV